MYELLRLASHGERKTRLMYGANISYALLAKYLDFLQEKGFLVASDDGVFAVTDTGIHFMGELGKVLKHFGPEERL